MSSVQPDGVEISNQNGEGAGGVVNNGADEFGELPAGHREEKQSQVQDDRNVEHAVRRGVPPNPEQGAAREAPQGEAVNNQGPAIRDAGRIQGGRGRGEAGSFHVRGRGAWGQPQHSGYGRQIPIQGEPGGNLRAPGANLGDQNYQ